MLLWTGAPLHKTGTANGMVSVSGTGNTTRTLTISGITGDGTLSISIPEGTANDTAGNPAPAAGPGSGFTVDNTAPVVNSGGNQIKNAVFTQTATGTDTDTMTCVWSEQAGPGIVTFGTANSLSTTISASIDGTYTIRFTATDTAGNTSFSDMAMVWDTTPPGIEIGAPSKTITNSGPVAYTVTYTGADAIAADAGVVLITTGTANGTITVTGTGVTTRTVTISNITGDGSIGISIAAGTANDTAGNLASASGPGPIFTVDNTAPVLITESPANGDSNIGVNSVVAALFNEAIDTSTISGSTFTVKDGASSVAGQVSYNTVMKSAIFTPAITFEANKTYTATVTAGIKDKAGNSLASDYHWMFNTVIAGVSTVVKNFTIFGRENFTTFP